MIAFKCMRAGADYLRRLRTIIVCIWALALAVASAQSSIPSSTAAQAPDAGAVRGEVRDPAGGLAAGAVVIFKLADEALLNEGTPAPAGARSETRTNAYGVYSLGGLVPGIYTLHAETGSGERSAAVRVELAPNETRTVNLLLVSASSSNSLSDPTRSDSSSSPKNDSFPAIKAPEFFDQPQFTVAGVTQATNAGGHGSDTVLRTSEALVKATGSLGSESSSTPAALPDPSDKASLSRQPVDMATLRQQRGTLSARLVPDEKLAGNSAREQQADLYHQLAQIDEEIRDPLSAVQEYQRSAELAPTEPRLFDWATELLTHRALEPATEIFSQGARLYPQSVRMLLGLGASWYARGADERASQYLVSASDLDPSAPAPYWFMGRLLIAQKTPSQELLDRMSRFARLAPTNASASYYYALAIWKHAESSGTLNEATLSQVEMLLQHAVQLEPKMGAAHLQLGILYWQQGDSTRAISALKEAIAVSPELGEAHYRLAQAYLRAGNQAAAQEEFRVHDELAKKSDEEAERGRREIQQFVVSLRDSK